MAKEIPNKYVINALWLTAYQLNSDILRCVRHNLGATLWILIKQACDIYTDNAEHKIQNVQSKACVAGES